MLATCLLSVPHNYALRGFKSIVLIAAVLSFVTPPIDAQAATNILVNDTWKDGNDLEPMSNNMLYAENNGIVGNDADADGDIESAWFQGGSGTLDPVAANGPLRGTIGTSSSSWTTFFT